MLKPCPVNVAHPSCKTSAPFLARVSFSLDPGETVQPRRPQAQRRFGPRILSSLHGAVPAYRVGATNNPGEGIIILCLASYGRFGPS